VIDHVGLGVSDLEQSKAFYQQALGPLGYQLLLERDGSAGLVATASRTSSSTPTGR
jgi:catechol 2,3-dioxygenase-like lactoylglutathione lyase family enzyme